MLDVDYSLCQPDALHSYNKVTTDETSFRPNVIHAYSCSVSERAMHFLPQFENIASTMQSYRSCSDKPLVDPQRQGHNVLGVSGSGLGKFIRFRLISLPIWLALSATLLLRFLRK